MTPPGRPSNEVARLARLRGYSILDTLPEQVFDDLTLLASRICNVPIALVSLIDEDRQWFKSRVGLEATQTSRDISFCGHVVHAGQRMVVPDATRDARFSSNPLVTGAPDIRFYAGSPLVVEGDLVMGTLCVIDTRPRELTREQHDMLDLLARQVTAHLEARLDAMAASDAQDALFQALETQRRFWQLSLDLQCLVSFEGYFLELSPSWERALGWSREELMSRPFWEFVHPDDRRASRQAAVALIEGGGTVRYENRYRTLDGQWRWLSWSLAADMERKVVYASARDVTRDKQTQREVEEARDAAERANRTKSDFLANMSHELRTPLNSVIGFTNILLKNKPGNLHKRQLDYLDRISTNGRHLLTLINEVLDLSKIESGQVELDLRPVELEPVLRGAIDHMEDRLLETGTTVWLDVPAGTLPLQADERALLQVVVNLLGNAVKFSRGGIISVSVVAGDESRPARIDVTDNGVGIAAEAIDRIFESFRQADESTAREFGGTGLGLTISQALCQAMGLELFVSSEHGQGARFSILVPEQGDLGEPWAPPREVGVRLPAQLGEVASRSEPEPGPGRILPQLNVLVVDDSQDARLVLCRYLEEQGCQVRAVGTGAEALNEARRLRPDLITLDLMMPGMSGWTVLKRLGDDPELANIPVVITSIVGSENRASLAGALAVLDKPVDRETLEQLLRQVSGDAACVLVVDDDPDTRELMRSWIEPRGLPVYFAEHGSAALELLDRIRPDLIILDLSMPVMDGFRFLTALRSRPEHESTPVAVCTAKTLDGLERAQLEEGRAEVVLRKDDLLESELAKVLERFLPRPPAAGLSEAT